MILKTLTYRRLFNTGSYTNESIELSGTLEPLEDPMNAYAELHEMAKQLHLSKNAEIYEQMGVQERIIEPVDERPLIEQINTCTDIEVLGTYKLLVRNDEVLNTAFRNKLIELSNPKQ